MRPGQVFNGSGFVSDPNGFSFDMRATGIITFSDTVKVYGSFQSYDATINGDLTLNGSLNAQTRTINCGAINASSNGLTCGNISLNGSTANFTGIYWNYGGSSKIYDDGTFSMASDNNMYFRVNSNTKAFTFQTGTVYMDKGLRVVGTVKSSITGYGYLGRYGYGIAGSNTWEDYGISVDQRVVASEFNAHSDVRIKTDIKEIPGNVALDKIRNVIPRSYVYVDKLKSIHPKGLYGFVAQEVFQTMPEAVSPTTDYVPNIYEIGVVSGSNKITLKDKSTEILDISLNLKIYLNEAEYIVNIKKIIDDRTFEITTNLEEITDNSENQIFVYGQEVYDFLTLEKNVIFTHAVAAIKLLDKTVEELKETVKTQQNQIDRLIALVERLTPA
jgi:hypothetical protein